MTNTSDYQFLVCPCNSVGDFPQKCPYHSPDYYTYPNYGQTYPVIAAAWECPRCNAMNAPHVSQCPCSKVTGGWDYQITYSNGTTTSNTITLGNPLHCEHANEVPMACPCKETCYCRQLNNTCGVSSVFTDE